MYSLISELLTRYERGAVTRRELLTTLTALAAGPAAQAVVGQVQDSPAVNGLTLDHVQLRTADPAVSREFYTKLLGGTVTADSTATLVRLLLPDGSQIVLARPPEGAGVIDHFGVAIADFDAQSVATSVTRTFPNVKVRGAATSVSVWDPDGIEVQLKKEGTED
jgi:catechol 2,3-dioxygenase-like lactoylglutathione lyase family enzyme